MSAVRCALAAALAAATVQAVYNPRYYVDEWDGICATGKFQTPWNLPGFYDVPDVVPDSLVTDVTAFPLAKDMTLKNSGIGITFEWGDLVGELPVVKAGGDNISHVLLDPSVEVDLALNMRPIQFHVHSVSEHAIGGVYYPAEAHIVTLVDKGEAPPEWGCDAVWDGGDPALENCTAVFGILFAVGDTTPEWLRMGYEEAPLEIDSEPVAFSLTEVNLDEMIPKDHSYWTYIGSLTTRPCNEGLRWHVFKQPVTITEETLQLMEDVMQFSHGATPELINGYRMNHRYLQDRNDRGLWVHKDPLYPNGGEMCPCDGTYGDMA